MLGGKPWGSPRHGTRLLFGSEVAEVLRAAIADVVTRQWGDNPPQQLRSPIRDGDEVGHPGLFWCHAGCPETEPPALYVRTAEGAVVDFDRREDRALIFAGAEVLVALDAEAYQTAPWAAGCDLTLRGVCFTGHGKRIGDGAADAFARALSTAEECSAGRAA
jgi:hypothetical protein